MYPGYLALGVNHDHTMEGPFIEIVNNSRAYAYARDAGICWLEECLDCPDTQTVVPGGPIFLNPILDPAPWYDPENPDTWGFYGVIGMEVTGSESSTGKATVTSTIQKGGVIGPRYYGPRTLTLRAIAIAKDECSLQAGLNWLKFQAFDSTTDPCEGDALTFFDCCPCVCENEEASGPCWAVTYDELEAGPSCDPTWWPSTYDDLLTGPPPDDEQWCQWPDVNWELDAGPPSWSCCVDACVAPYLRQYHHVRITEGPIVLSHPTMHSGGALVEFEMTIVAADPDEYAVSQPLAGLLAEAPAPLIEEFEPMQLATLTDRRTTSVFDRGGRSTAKRAVEITQRAAARRVEPVDWVRDSGEVLTDRREIPMGRMMPTIKIRSFDEPAEQVRIGLWNGAERVAGYLLPAMPPNSILTIDGSTRRVYAIADGERRLIPGFVRGWDGEPLTHPRLPRMAYDITVDQPAGAHARLLVNVLGSPVAAG